jgi:uncharacterized protein YbcV (DUF1398 family)
MSERGSTVVCCLKKNSPKIITYDIHKWIHDNLELIEEDVQTVQIEGIKRTVYVKLYTGQRTFATNKRLHIVRTYKWYDFVGASLPRWTRASYSTSRKPTP